MDVKSITVNAAETLVARSMQGNVFPAADHVQVQVTDSNTFGPEYEVNISREGRKLSRQAEQTKAAEQSTQGGRRIQSGQMEAPSFEKDKMMSDPLMTQLIASWAGYGYTEDEIQKLAEIDYKDIRTRQYEAYTQQGIKLDYQEVTEEELAELKSMAQKSKENLANFTHPNVDPSNVKDLIEEAKAAGTYWEYHVK